MLSLNQSFDDTRNIKVLVVPIGNNSLFDNHFQVVSRLRDVPFYELNRPVSKNNANPAFKYFNWNNGNLLFDYLRYDRVPRGPGDLDNFQSSKRVLMIMGIINYPELGTSLNRIDEEMDYFSKRHPSILLRRIFVFNYSFDSIPTSLPTNSKCATPPPASAVVLKPLSDDASSLVIFPPEGICEGGTSMVDVHLNEVMSHAAVRIIGLLERQMEFCDDCRSKNILPVHLVQGTLYDELEDFSGTTKDSITSRSSSIVSAVNTIRGAAVGGGGVVGGSTKPGNNSTNLQYKKKPNGRIRKWMGDLSLQVCSPIDAIENYIPAIADCRALGDGLWLAGALEGYTTAIMLLLQQGGNINIEDIIGKDLKTITIAPGANNSADLDPEGGAPVYSLQTMSAVEKAYRLAEERANEAISIYAKNIVFCTMEVECTLRLARMYENCSVELPNKEQMVVDYVMRAVAVPGLNTQQSIECIIEGALMFRRLGLQRKYGFFLYIAALLCAENDNYAMAHTLMHNACNEFGIHTGTEHFSPMDMTQNTADHPGLPSLCDEDGVRVVHPDQSWSSMRTMLLSNSVLMAKEHGDVVSAARFLSALMRLISELELRHNQTRANWAQANQKYFGISANNSSSGINNYNNNTNNNNGVTSSSKSSSTVNNTMLNSPLTEDTLKRLQQNSNDEPPHSDYKHKPSITTNNTSSVYNSSGFNNEQSDFSVQSKRQLFPLTNSNTVATGGRQNSLDGSVAGTVNGTPFRSPIGTRQPESVNKRTSVDDIAVDLAQNFADSFKRSFAVPKLPATLVNLVQKDSTDNGNTSYRPHSPSKVSLNANGLIEKRPNELIGDRIKRHLHNDSEMFKRHFLSAVNNSDFTHGDFNNNSGNNNGGLGTDSSYVVDIMTSLSSLLLTQYIPLDQQYEIMHLFGTLNKALDTVHVVTLPVCLITLRPINLADPHKPYLLDCHAITNAKKGLEMLQENYKRELQNGSVENGDNSDNVEVHSHDSHATNGQSQESSSSGANWDVVKAAAAAGGVSSANVTSKASSTLFYDPFAAARAKKVVKALDSVLWCSQQICTVVAVFSNSLSVPIQITNIVPELEVIDSNTGLPIHSSDSGDSDGSDNKTDETLPDNQHNGKYYRTYPKPVTIPANTTHFEVELHLKPLCESVSLRFTGVRVFMYNASYVVPVDDAGSAVKDKCAEICTVEGYPYKAVETKGKNNKSSTANTNTKNIVAGAVKDGSTMKSRGVATNLVKIACAKSSDYSLLASWSDNNQPVPDSVVPSTVTAASKKGFGGNGSSTANRLSLKAPMDIKNAAALRNTIATTGVLENELPQPLKLSLYPGETRCESVQIAQLLGNNLQDLSTTDTRNLVSDFKVTLTQYPLNLAVNGTNSAELKKQTVSSTLLDFHGPLNCAVSLADVASTVVQNNRNNNKSAAACSVIFNNSNTNLETNLQLAFAYCAEPTVLELEFELVTSNSGSGSSNGGSPELSAIGELNKYFNLVHHHEVSACAEVSDSNNSNNNAVRVSGNDSLITLLATTANSDVFTLYSRKIKLIVHLMPSAGLLCNSLRLTSTAVGGSVHEIFRLNATLAEMVVAHGNISNVVSNNSGKNGSSNRNSMRIDGLSVGGSKLNVKVLSDRNHVVLQFTNSSSLPVYLSNSKDTLAAAISKHIRLSDIHSTSSCEEYKQTEAESNLYTVAVDRILEYNELVSGDSAVLVAVVQPNSIHNVIVNIPYATFECEDNGSDAAISSSIAEKVKGVLFWGVYDTTRTIGRNSNSTIQDNIRYGTVCSETAAPTVTIANSKSSTIVSNSNELILSAQSNTICDLFKHRPPVSVEATITYTETGTENTGSNSSTITIDSRIKSNTNKISRVPLQKFIDITARVNLIANRIYKQYAQHTTTEVTLKFELAVVIVSSEDPITSQLQPEAPGNTATGGILSQDSVTNSFDFSNNVTFLAQQPQNNYILTGQPYSRHQLHQMKEIKHKLRVCFLNSGSYAVYTLLKFGGSEWWTPAQPIRIYVC